MTRVLWEIADREARLQVGAAVKLAQAGKLQPSQAIDAPDGRDHGNVKGYVVGGAWIFERLIPHELRPWRSFEISTPYANGVPDPAVGNGQEIFWANSHYLVFERRIEAENGTHHMKHLSIRTVENDVRHDWRDFQRIKNALAGPDWEGVELYPSVDRLVDSANQYHLWCYPYQLPFGFNSSLVMDHGLVEQAGGAQRPFTEGDARP